MTEEYQQLKAEGQTGEPGSFFKKVNNLGQPESNGVGDVSPAEKKKTLIALLLALGILQTLYMNLAAFLPNYANNYYYWVDGSRVGLILAMFQIAYLLMAPIVGMSLQKVGRKNMILIGYIVCTVATISFGLCSHLPKNCNPELKPEEKQGVNCPDPSTDLNLSHSKVFFGISLVVRFIQGLGDSMVATSAYSIVSIEFPVQREIYIGYCLTAVGLGLLLGPVIGTSIYQFAGYEWTFYSLAGILILSLIIAIFMLPNRINKYSNDKPNEIILDQDPQSRPSIQGIRPQGIAERHSVDMVALAKVSERYSRRSHLMQAKITYKIFFTNMRAMTAVVAAMFAMIFMLFYEPIFAPYVKEAFDFPENKIGYLLAIACFTYALGSPLVGILCTKVQRKYITCFSFFLTSASLFVTGPSLLLGFPQKLWLTLVGEAAIGFSVAFLFVPLLPEIISAVAEKEKLENSPFLSDKASGIYNSAYGIGNCLAPILGGALSSAYGYRGDNLPPDVTKGFPFTCDVMAVSSAIFGVIYFFFAILPSWIENRKNREQREQKLLDDLKPGAVQNSLILEFEQNSKSQIGGVVNDSGRQLTTA